MLEDGEFAQNGDMEEIKKRPGRQRVRKGGGKKEGKNE